MLLQKSVSFLSQHSAREALQSKNALIEKQFLPIHNAWLKKTSARRAEEKRIARAKLDMRGNEYRRSAGAEDQQVFDACKFSSKNTENPKLLQNLKREALAKVINEALKCLHEHTSAWLFKEPVDWKGLGLPHYPNIVKHPIDLSTIQKHYEEGKYKRADMFVCDVLLMVQNCVLFNSRDTSSQKYVRLAKLLWKKFVKVFESLMMQEEIVFTKPSLLNNDDILENVDTVCTCCVPYNSSHFVVACDGSCGGWYHPSCIGLIRCGDYLIAVDENTGLETRRFDLSKSFTCPMCTTSNPEYTSFGKIALKTPIRDRLLKGTAHRSTIRYSKSESNSTMHTSSGDQAEPTSTFPMNKRKRLATLRDTTANTKKLKSSIVKDRC